MDVWSIDKIILFAVFFVPGFISIKVFDLLIPSDKRDSGQWIFEAIAFSCLNFAALSWLIVIIFSGNLNQSHPLIFFVSLFLILFVAPIAWPIVYLKMIESERVSQMVIHPVQKPWDWFFRRKDAYWVIVHLVNGDRVGGRFDRNSFASSYPSPEQLYLEETWHLDETGGFISKVAGTKGIIIFDKEMRAVEFYAK